MNSSLYRLTLLFLILSLQQAVGQSLIDLPVVGTEDYSAREPYKLPEPASLRSEQFPSMRTANGVVVYSPTGVFTIYDLQSNAVPQTVWQDPNNSQNVHAVFITSSEQGFADRACTYLYSSNFGSTWQNRGPLAPGEMGSFSAVSGLSTGQAVISTYNTQNGTPRRLKIYYDQQIGAANFTLLDPGQASYGESIWPRHVVSSANKIIFAGSSQVQDTNSVNTVTNLAPPGAFSGYQNFPGDRAETYSLAISPNGNTIGYAYIGTGTDENDALYRSSVDNGITWSTPIKFWNWNVNTDSLGVYRGISLVFGNNNQPFVAFNTSPLVGFSHFQNRPSQIRIWSPSLNNGIPVTIADQNNVPYYPNGGDSDPFLPLCRPSIGRASSGEALIVAFSATTGLYGSGSNAYYCTYITKTLNLGTNWTTPEKISPASPLRDWRYICVSPVSFVSGPQMTVQMVCQSDSVPGSYALFGSPGRAELYGFRYTTDAVFVLQPPTLILPTNGSINVLNPPRLDWTNVPNAVTYQLQVSTDSLFSNPAIDTSGLIQSVLIVDSLALNYGTKYFWRVRANTQLYTGPWSTVWNFRIITQLPFSPELYLPQNGAINVSLTPRLDWFEVINATSFRAQIARDSNFINIDFDQSGILTTFTDVPSNILRIDSTYYWRVAGINSFGTGTWSAVWKFNTLTTLPSAPTLTAPFNGTVNSGLTLPVSWTSVPGALFYGLQVSTDSLFGSFVLNESTLPLTTYNIGPSILSYGNKYFWRVHAGNFNGYGPWSVIWNFSTTYPPVSPVPVRPLNGSDTIDITPLIDWSSVPNTSSYRLLVSTDSLFSNVIFDSSGITVSQIIIPSPYLTYNTKYFWKSNATNFAGTSPWSIVWNFKTRQISVPSTPVLLSPANNSTDVSLTPLFDWQNANFATSYSLNIATDINFNNPVYTSENITQSQFNLPSGILNSNTLYFWRVRAGNTTGTSSWSSEFVFRTLIVGISQIGTETPTQYKLFDNYPNPFNPETKIRFDIPKSSSVKILLYDITGKKVLTIADRTFNAGTFETTLDASALPSGIYFYRLETQEYSSTKSLMVIK